MSINVAMDGEVRSRSSWEINPLDILQCLGTTVSEFFQEEPEDQIVFQNEDYFEKIDYELGSKTEWIIPNAQKNMMEPIRLTLKPGGLTYRDLPHEGEEFGYVLKGSIKIHIGHKSSLRKKENLFISHLTLNII